MAAATAAILLATSSVASAVTQASAAKSQGKFAQQQAESQARLSEMQSEDALKRGQKEAANVKKKANLLQGSQRAAMAAQGIDVSSGSAGDILAETAESGSLDALTVKNNAFREAWGYRAQASQQRFEGRMKRSASQFEARNTLLVGGIQAIGYGAQAYGEYKKENPDKKTTTTKSARTKTTTSGSSYNNYGNYA